MVFGSQGDVPFIADRQKDMQMHRYVVLETVHTSQRGECFGTNKVQVSICRSVCLEGIKCIYHTWRNVRKLERQYITYSMLLQVESFEAVGDLGIKSTGAIRGNGF